MTGGVGEEGRAVRDECARAIRGRLSAWKCRNYVRWPSDTYSHRTRDTDIGFKFIIEMGGD